MTTIKDGNLAPAYLTAKHNGDFLTKEALLTLVAPAFLVHTTA